MSRHLSWHTILTNGVGQCGKPMWAKYNPTTYERIGNEVYTYEEIPKEFARCDAGFCDQPAYGPATGAPTGSVLLCPKHGGPKEFHGGGI